MTKRQSTINLNKILLFNPNANEFFIPFSFQKEIISKSIQ